MMAEETRVVYAKIKVDQAKAEEIRDFYHATEISDDLHPYDYFAIVHDGVQIHAYRNRKEIYTIVFSGSHQAKEEAQQFSENVSVQDIADKPAKEKDPYFSRWDDLSSQIGSDEVGVGDFFGPLVVAASYVTGKDISYLESLRVNDSKKMTDDYILSIGAELKRRIKNYVILVSPEKLSVLTAHDFSIHKTMAKCHNLAQIGVKEKYGLSDDILCYIDQFEPEPRYRALVGADIITNPLYFRTKGETYYPSVAVASVIARYTFLKEWMVMEKKLGTTIPKGANATVDMVYGRLVNQLGHPVVDPYVKRFFRNFQRT